MSELALQLIAKEKKEKTGVLDLGNCGLTELPEELFELVWLRELNVSSEYQDEEKKRWKKSKNTGLRNNFSRISNKITALNNLLILRINGKWSKKEEITDIKFLKSLSKLQTLNLSSNKIVDISPLQSLTQLRYLDISDNQINNYSFLKPLINLQFLDLSSNQITDISFLLPLTQLETLILSRNKIHNISFLQPLTQLKTLTLSRNKIHNISFLQSLTQLQYLNLSDNLISEINALQSLTQLKSLFLRKNQITNIRPLKALRQLQNLHLSDNQISDIPSLEHLHKLKSLYLRKNQVSNISVLGKLVELQILYLRGNQIKDITPLLPLLKLGNMKISTKKRVYKGHIYLNENPIQTPPLEIVQQGNQAILNYYQELEKQNTTELYEAKLLILGEGGVGKTSLAKKLLNKNAKLPQEEETTKGIDIHEYYFQTKDHKEFRINIWDFGGQEIYHATHQFFLTKRSLYVLVDDTRTSDKNASDFKMNYWLETVELFGGDSPLVIVQNEKGDRSKDLDLKNIQSQFGNVKGRYVTNLLTCRQLSETKAALEFFIQELPHIGQKLPKSWIDIRNALEVLKKNRIYYISLKNYYEICTVHKIEEEERALYLSQYLHDLGVFLHFQEDDLLRKVVILHNEWATDAVYKVLDCETVKQKQGRFTRKDLKIIWGDAESKMKYRNMHGELLALMKNFELCYQLEGTQNTFLAPQLFPETQPDYEWDEANNLILRYQYGFMPKGLLSRFIVRMHHYVKDLKKAWKNGAVLQKNSTFAEVVSLYARQEIRIRVRGNENKAFLDIIIEEFEKLHAQYEGIKVDKFMPCCCSLCQIEDWKGKYYFKYEVLKRAYQLKRDTVECQKSFEAVNLHRLISNTLIANKMEEFFQTKRDFNQFKQRHSGAGDNVGGNKIIHHHHHNAKKQEIQLPSLFEKATQRLPIDKEEIRELFMDGELDEVFEILMEKAMNEALETEIALLKSQWRSNKRAYRKGTITRADFEAKNQQVNETLFEWILKW